MTFFSTLALWAFAMLVGNFNENRHILSSVHSYRLLPIHQQTHVQKLSSCIAQEVLLFKVMQETNTNAVL